MMTLLPFGKNRKKKYAGSALLPRVSQSALEEVSDGLLFWDLETGSEGVSPRFKRLLEAAAVSPSPYSNFLQTLVPPDRERLDVAVRELRRTGQRFRLEVKTNQKKIYHVQGYRFHDPDNIKKPPLADVLCVFDQTDLRSHLEELKDREVANTRHRDMMQNMIDGVPVPIWVRGRDTSLLMVNKAYLSAVHLESRTTNIPEIAEGLAGERGRELARKVIETDRTAFVRGMLILGGQRRYVEVIESPLRHSGGEFLSVGYVRDLTEQFELEGQVQRLGRGHEQVLQVISLAIAIYGSDRQLSFYNAAFEQTWQLNPQFLKTKPTLSEVFDKLRERRNLPEVTSFLKYKEDHNAYFNSLLEAKEELMHLPDGRTFRLLISPHPQGGLLFLYEDVSENLHLTSSVNTLQEVQRETIDNLYEGVAVFGSDGRLKLSNPTYRKLWGLSDQEAQAIHLSEVLERNKNLFPHDPVDWGVLKKNLLALYTDRRPRDGRLERTDGIILDYAVVPLPDGACLLSYVDITNQFQVEIALRQRNEALEAADKLKSEFISNVSYGLRTPLNTIRGFAEILDKGYFGELNQKQAGYVVDILKASEELMNLINDILDLASIEAGYMTLQYTTFDLKQMLLSLSENLENRAKSGQLEIITDLPDNLGQMEADEQRLRQALFNLVVNSIQYTPAGGKIIIRAEAGEDGMISITVSDTGIGIPKDQHTRVFEKFVRGENQRRRSGIGMGLSLVKSFIDLHQGRIELDSEVGQGTRITLYIPRQAQSKSLVEKVIHKDQSGGDPKGVAA